MGYGPGGPAEQVINILCEVAAYALKLGCAPVVLHGWIETQARVHEAIGNSQPDHAGRLRHILEALCWYAPGAGVKLEDLRAWVDDRIENRDDIHNIMLRLRNGTPEVFGATFAAAAPGAPDGVEIQEESGGW
jgi:hypothetical protein